MGNSQKELEIILGNEAAGRGALDAGISAAYSYPGTPASELQAYIQRKSDQSVHSEWSPNEAVAYAKGLGMSHAGKRAIVSMKHVGVNVASDTLMSSALTGANGGLVLVVADDPSMHSSQSEQDSRYYAQFGRIPCLEPRNHQEIYDITRNAFDLSEKYKTPIITRLTTRLSHSRSSIQPRDSKEQNEINVGKREDFTLLPSISRRLYAQLIEEKMPKFLAESESSKYNILTIDPNSSIGIITSGTGSNYFKENLDNKINYSHLDIGFSFPLPIKKIKELADNVDEIIVIEDGQPFIESQLKGIIGESKVKIGGKLSNHVKSSGELTPDIVRTAMGKEPLETVQINTKDILRPRAPQICKGCPHSHTYKALNEVRKDIDIPVIHGDIGCYTLGFYPPFQTIDSTINMGASISMAMGSSDAGLKNVVAVIGDSTFTHAGMPGLLEAAKRDVPVTLLILDNETIAMTGGQETYATGRDLFNVVKGLGVNEEHLKEMKVTPKNHDNNVNTLSNEIKHDGLSVLISRGKCVHNG